MNQKRISENPLAGERAVFLETSADTNGSHSLIEVDLSANAKGTPVHYHDSITETFVVLEGELGIELNKKKIILQKGETAHVPMKAHHRFYNPSDKPVKFQCKVVPGCPGFENSLKIVHGLVRDGKCNSNGIPKNISELAVLFELGEGKVPGILALLTPVMSVLAKRARKKGVEERLIRQYC